MHSVAERTSDCTVTLFCCADSDGGALGSIFGPVATLTTSATAASGARIIPVVPLSGRTLATMPDTAHAKSCVERVPEGEIRATVLLESQVCRSSHTEAVHRYLLIGTLMPGTALSSAAGTRSQSDGGRHDAVCPPRMHRARCRG